MSRTLRDNGKGEKVRQYRERKYKPSDKKFFGFTSGQHSCGIKDRVYKNGKVVYTDTDKTPIKGEDFVKYGWPMETRHKKMIERMKNK